MIRQDLDTIEIPQEPGVYFWRGVSEQSGGGRDADSSSHKATTQQREILYIGKATNLRDRTRSYFAPDLIKTRGPHIVDMVFTAQTLTWQVTGSVLEALILEANLIKKYKPYYNTKEKDDKSFNCVIVTKEDYPRVLLVREKDIATKEKTVTNPRLGLVEQKYDLVVGPFPRGSAIKDALQIIRKIFPFRDRVSAQKDKEVFYRQIGLTPDVSTVDAAALYRKNIGRIKLILQGKLQSLIKDLKKEMNIAAKALAFEEAEMLKQKVFALEHIQDVSLMKRDLIEGEISGFRIESYDIAHMSGKNMVGVMTVVENALAHKNEYRKFIIKGFTTANDPGALKEILTRRLAHTEWKYPDMIVVDGNSIQINAAQAVLDAVQLTIPIVAVTKDERHRPKSLSGDKDLIDAHKYAILLANSEAHRFAIDFHKQRRAKAMLY